jgi:hypothetical protein
MCSRCRCIRYAHFLLEQAMEISLASAFLEVCHPGSLPWKPKLAISSIRNKNPPRPMVECQALYTASQHPHHDRSPPDAHSPPRQTGPAHLLQPSPHISSNRAPLAAPPRDVDHYADDPQRAPHRPQGSLVTFHIPQRPLCPLC